MGAIVIIIQLISCILKQLNRKYACSNFSLFNEIIHCNMYMFSMINLSGITHRYLGLVLRSMMKVPLLRIYVPVNEILLCIALVSSKGSGESAHAHIPSMNVDEALDNTFIWSICAYTIST